MNAGQVVREALDVDIVHRGLHHAAADLHARADVGIDEVQWHPHVDLAVLVHALEIHVQHLLLPRVHLVVAQQDLEFLAVEREIQYRGVERLELQLEQQRVVVELDVLRRLVRAIYDARHPSGAAQAAVRTRSLLRARECSHFDFHHVLQKI